MMVEMCNYKSKKHDYQKAGLKGRRPGLKVEGRTQRSKAGLSRMVIPQYFCGSFL